MKKPLLLASVLLAGCTTFNIPSYSPEHQNIEAIGKRQGRVNVIPAPPSFEDAGKIMCRGAGDVAVQQDRTYSDYIFEALKAELASQGAIDDKGGKAVTVRLSKVDFSSSLGATNWFIDGEYAVDGKTQSISTVFNMDSNYMGNVACNNMALNFPKAVSQHLLQLYRSPIFLSAAGERVTASNTSDPNARLENLKKAFQAGLVSEEEYKAKRSQIIQDF